PRTEIKEGIEICQQRPPLPLSEDIVQSGDSLRASSHEASGRPQEGQRCHVLRSYGKRQFVQYKSTKPVVVGSHRGSRQNGIVEVALQRLEQQLGKLGIGDRVQRRD